MRAIAAIVAMAMINFACQHDPIIPPEPAISFSQQIAPMIISNCATTGCHDGITGGEEELPALTNYDQIRRHVKPGNARDSKLYKYVTATGGEDAMPPDRPLTEEQIQLIFLWISQGAKNN
jgi:hypothetical protein